MLRSKIIGAALAMVGLFLASLPLAYGQQDSQQPPDTPEVARSDSELEEAAALWEDIIHYYRVAQHDLAVSAAEAFDDVGLNSAEVMRVVEELSPYRNHERTLRRAAELSGEPGDTAERLLQLLRESRLDLSREGGRIRDSIDSLDQGLRHRLSSHEQLRRAGEYAAPELLAVLVSEDSRDRELAPYVMEAMVEVGRPIVPALSEALAGLAPVPRQQVAEVLGRIGYPLALPYLRAEIEREDVSEDTQHVLQQAFDEIVEQTGTPQRASAADLFLRLAEDYYAGRDSLILQPNQPYNLMWTYSRGAGLTFRQVPTPIFHDAMAMRTARRALQLNPNLSASLSLWVTANFRRENNLPAGEEDPSYGEQMRSPHYYATLAGPRHLRPVLQRALRDRDAALALDAIAALDSTATSESMLNLEGRIQPLIAALNYPDRRVRFDAAFSIAAARPTESFDGGQRVIPVLAEAIREAGDLYAAVLGPDSDSQNVATQQLSDAGDFNILRGASVDVIAAQVAEAPGVDLVVIHSPFEEAQAAVENVKQNFKLMGTPVVVLAHPGDDVSLRRDFEDYRQVTVIDVEDSDAVASAVREATANVAENSFSEEEAEQYALRSLDLLREIKLRGSGAFDPDDARAALLAALDDERESVALGAADILTRFEGERVQQALASRGLGTDRGESMQVAFLRHLATSARIHGNQLTRAQIRDLVSLVNEAQPGELADAAAEAHGALDLTTSNVVESIAN